MIKHIQKLLAVTCLFFLLACIPVDDFGEYWDKGVIDPNLSGTWVSGEGDEENTITQVGDVYQASTVKLNKPKVVQKFDEKALFKSLVIARNKYLMSKESGKHPNATGGSLIKYKIDGNALYVFLLKKEGVMKLKEKYPDLEIVEDKDFKIFDDVTICFKLLDDHAITVLADIPDKPEYWKKAAEFHRKQTDQ